MSIYRSSAVAGTQLCCALDKKRLRFGPELIQILKNNTAEVRAFQQTPPAHLAAPTARPSEADRLPNGPPWGGPVGPIGPPVAHWVPLGGEINFKSYAPGSMAIILKRPPLIS